MFQRSPIPWVDCRCRLHQVGNHHNRNMQLYTRSGYQAIVSGFLRRYFSNSWRVEDHHRLSTMHSDWFERLSMHIRMSLLFVSNDRSFWSGSVVHSSFRNQPGNLALYRLNHHCNRHHSSRIKRWIIRVKREYLGKGIILGKGNILGKGIFRETDLEKRDTQKTA